MVGTGKSIEIKCRRCGKMAKAEDFTLDYVYKMAVCPSCVKDRKANAAKTLKETFKEAEHENIAEAPKKQSAPGWDAEDDYLEKLARQKQKAEWQVDATPKPYQMGGFSQPASPYNQPKPSSMAEPSSMQRMTAKPSESHERAKQPMNVADFGMRFTKPVSPQPAQTSQSSKPSVTDFGMKSSNKAQNEPSIEHHSVLSDRAEKAGQDPNKTKSKCKKCGYEFWYNRETDTPRMCPYCNTQVMHLI